MQPLRQARFLARLVLGWFVLALGIATAAPLVHPQAMELVCSGQGALKLLVKSDDGGTARSHTLDCPLCATLDAPPPVLALTLPAPQPIGTALQPIPSLRVAAGPTAPLPARGPPSSSGL